MTRPTPGRCPGASGARGYRRSRLKVGLTLDEMGKPLGALDFYREILANEPDTAAARIKALGGEDGAAKEP
jgi:hypothetical protein